MKNKLGITEGEWLVYGNLVYALHKVQFGRSTIDINRIYCRMYADNSNREASVEITPNLKLIADAGNTAQKCGLLPSELLEQRNLLIETLEDVLFHLKESDKISGSILESKMKRTLKQIKGE